MAKGITTAETTDEQFVANLYLNLLRRSPKSGEVKHWTGVLATGAMRSDIVEVFMSSSEFITLQRQKERFQVASSNGAEGSRHEQEILSKLQARVASQQNIGYEDRAASQTRDVGDVEASAISKLSSHVWEASEAVGQLNPRNSGPLNYVVQTAKRVVRRSLTWYTRSLQNFNSQVAKALEEHGAHINSLDKETLRLDGEISRLGTEISRLQAGYLQELIRANELAIQEQLVPYIDFFQGVSPVLDLGCGRGEFLALLKDNGIPSYGIDSDEIACQAGRRKSLRILNEDILEHLRQLPDRSLGGVFSARAIEFLPSHAQIELISLCSMKIKPGGVLVIETANPDSRLGYGRSSYLDPSHMLAVPPELIKSALEGSHFRNVKITVLAPVEESLAQLVSAVDVVDSSKGRGNAPPSNRLMVSPVYAAVGWRS